MQWTCLWHFGRTIFKVATDGTVAAWKSDPSLVGAVSSIVHVRAPFPIGANGIVKIGSAMYVANTNLAQVVEEIAINGDGSAGAATVVAGPDCEALGVDGIAVDADGTSLLGVLNSQGKIVRIDAAGTVTDVFAGPPLDNPGEHLRRGEPTGPRPRYITNSSFFNQASPTPGSSYPLE